MAMATLQQQAQAVAGLNLIQMMGDRCAYAMALASVPYGAMLL